MHSATATVFFFYPVTAFISMNSEYHMFLPILVKEIDALDVNFAIFLIIFYIRKFNSRNYPVLVIKAVFYHERSSSTDDCTLTENRF